MPTTGHAVSKSVLAAWRRERQGLAMMDQELMRANQNVTGEEAFRGRLEKSLRVGTPINPNFSQRLQAREIVGVGKEKLVYRKPKPFDPGRAAEKIDKAISWYGEDEEAIFSALRGITNKEDADNLRRVWAQSHDGEQLDKKLQDNLSDVCGPDLTYAQALLSGDRQKAWAAGIHWATSGVRLGLNKAWVISVLQERLDYTRATGTDPLPIAAEYRQLAPNKGQLEDFLKEKFKGREREEVLALYYGDWLRTEPARMKKWVEEGKGAGNSMNSLLSICQSLLWMDEADRASFLAAYKKQFNEDFLKN